MTVSKLQNLSPTRLISLYPDDVGAFTYATTHPMKPHRMRITHDLISAYGMLEQMHVIVRIYQYFVLSASSLHAETKASVTRGHDRFPYRRIHQLS